MLVAVAQLCSSPSISRNLSVCRRLVERAAKAGAKLVYLPEAADYIAPSTQVYDLASALDKHIFLNGLREQAKLNCIWVGVGIHERPDPNLGLGNRVYNTHVMIDSEGDIKRRYEKLHLFDVDLKDSGGPTLLESRTTIPGSRIVRPVLTPAGNVGLLTCYDLRFPEPSLLLLEQGAQILTYPSAFTIKTGKAHWETLLRARAIETQSYVLASAQVGEHFPGRASYGRAMIIDPWGTILAQCKEFEMTSGEEGVTETDESLQGELAIAEIDFELLTRVRKEMPLVNQRRRDIYSLQESDV
ncbi:Carbon-nitrogen hydrolase [Serendipita sp. 411]|nr:Carbon-nitrogen hydrolase [Serendipita sp. 400]KAG8856382.1 Carbon-nitrogen hydrolase [Serendipita sp. 411]